MEYDSDITPIDESDDGNQVTDMVTRLHNSMDAPIDAQPIWNFLKNLQDKESFMRSHFNTSLRISEDMINERRAAISWILMVLKEEELKLDYNAFFLATVCLDFFLRTRKIAAGNLKLYAISALNYSMKMGDENDMYLFVSEFIETCEEQLDAKVVSNMMNSTAIELLNYDFIISPYTFVIHWMEIVLMLSEDIRQFEPIFRGLVSYFLHLGTYNYETNFKYSPSRSAAISILSAITVMLKSPIWPEFMVCITGYTIEDLRDGLLDYAELYYRGKCLPEDERIVFFPDEEEMDEVSSLETYDD
jgi:hypothetical protein